MAATDVNASTSALNCSIDTLNSLKISNILNDSKHLYLSYDGKRVKWFGSLELLKEFVEKNLIESGKWTSPNGAFRRFKSYNSDLCLTWYFGKPKSLLFQGKTGSVWRNILIQVCQKASLTNDEVCLVNDVQSNRLSTPVSDYVSPDRLNCTQDNLVNWRSSKSGFGDCIFSSSCQSVSEGWPEIKLSLEILQSQVDALQSLANTQNISLSEDVYLSEITRLNEELSVEKEKRQETERKLQSLTDKLFQLENCNLNTKLANNTTNNENLASSELTNFKACIVIPDDTFEGSHTIAESANNINIQSGNVDLSGDSSHNTLLFEDGLPNRNKTSISHFQIEQKTGSSRLFGGTKINNMPNMASRKFSYILKVLCAA